MALSLLCMWVRHEEEDASRNSSSSSSSSSKWSRCNRRKSIPKMIKHMKQFSPWELNAATNGFNHLLGSGGHGCVYLGTLQNGTKVAVKRFQKSIHAQNSFLSELRILACKQHTNLIRVEGLCNVGRVKYLVYEFAPNGCLEDWLFHKSQILSWNTRWKIAQGVARGLACLHADKVMLHLDVKPANILLDADFSPKLADFGSSLSVQSTEDCAVTRMKGTAGYLAPEWLLEGSVSSKCDVYSYGIVLLELVSGQRCMDQQRKLERKYFPCWAWKTFQAGQIGKLVDKKMKLGSACELQEVRNGIHVAICCIQEDPKMRPSMDEVVQMLQGSIGVPQSTMTAAPFRCHAYSF